MTNSRYCTLLPFPTNGKSVQYLEFVMQICMLCCHTEFNTKSRFWSNKWLLNRQICQKTLKLWVDCFFDSSDSSESDNHSHFWCKKTNFLVKLSLAEVEPVPSRDVTALNFSRKFGYSTVYNFLFNSLQFMTADLWYLQSMDVLDFWHKVEGRSKQIVCLSHRRFW